MFFKNYSWVEISKSAFNQNISTYKAITPAGTKLAVVIKSNAYGHDLIIMAYLCQKNPHVDWICINSLSEALLLRNTGITKPILVMNLIDDNPAKAITNNIDLIGHTMTHIQRFSLLAKKEKKPIYIHLKVDTGMSRLGFLPDELLSCIDEIIRLPYIGIRGIFSHFAESSSADLRYTHYQADRFSAVLTALKNRNIEISLRHIANSAAVPIIPFHEVNMVRIGAGAFGLYPSYANTILAKKHFANFELKPIFTWKTRITSIRKVPANSFVGYGRTYTTDRKTGIGYLPVGYHEGFDKKLSNRGVVWLPKQQQYAPIIGMICMNMTMIDLSAIEHVCEGDEVVLIGPQKHIFPEDIAHMVGITNLREITGRIISTIPRIIVS